MPYPNDNKLNIVISQTSGSADNTGKFPFTERIISGSNLFILTDANGNLTGSTSIPGGSFTNLFVTSLTASFISASQITASSLVVTDNVTLGNSTSDVIQITGSTSISGSLTVTGNIAGTIDSASAVLVSSINTGSTYYVTFVDGTTGVRQLKTDVDILSYVPSTNTLAVGTSASGSVTVGSKVTMQDLAGTSQLRVGINTTDTASLLVSSNAFQVVKGQGPGVDKVFTNLELSASNNVLITGDLTVNGGDIVLSNTATNISLLDNVGGALDIKEGSNSYIKIATTNTTENVTFGTTPTVYIIKTTDNDLVTYDNGALIVGGGVGINKNLFVGGNTTTLGNSSITGSLTVDSTLKVNGNSILGDSLSDVNTSSGSLRVLNTTQATAHNAAALVVDGGVGIGKNLYVSGSTFLYGDLTIYGTGSVVNISSSTVIIGDNRVVLNAGTPIQRYAGIDVFDSGSGTYTNNVTSSLLWDALSDNWLLVSNNQTTGNPLTQSSAIMIGGPSGSFGNESLLTVNYIPKVQSTGKNLQNSALIDTGALLSYTGTGISSSQITASQLTVAYTGSITYATGVYITYTTGSFTTITITTGSSPGVGNQVPSSPTATGLAGQINVDNNFIYVYTNQVWKRVPLSTWTA
jgi:cytoskeletal protein CcmA (bactofilin family)